MDSTDKIYAGFFIRILSGLIDYVIYLIISFIIYLLLKLIGEMPKYYIVIYLLFHLLYHFIYNITIPQYFGGTFGKLLLKIKILKTDYKKIGFKESFLRYLFVLLWYLYSTIDNIKSLINTTDGSFNEFMTFSEWINSSNSNEPKINVVFLIAINIWIFSEYIVLLFNKEKKGLQDYFAGTVIVNTKYYR